MTAEHIHDALTLLPADLIAEADRKRGGKPKGIPWMKYAAMAACFTLVLFCGWSALLLFGGMGGSATEQAAAEIPMMQAPEAAPMELPAEEAAEETLCGLPTVPAEDRADTAGSTASNSLCIDHSHRPAEAFEEEAGGGWCGNMTATVTIGETCFTLSGEDAVVLTDILYHLDYGPEQLCSCETEFTAETEMGSGYAVSLSNYFVRYNGGQAALTIEQAEALEQLIQQLEE